MYGLNPDGKTCSRTGLEVTKTAIADIVKNEACYLENIDHCFEEMQEHLQEAIKLGRFCYGREMDRKFLELRMQEILDSAISEYGGNFESLDSIP